MAIIDPSANGQPKQITVPDEIVVTLKLTQASGGLALFVSHDPHVFPDTVIELCHRAARVYERDPDAGANGDVPASEPGALVIVLTARFHEYGLSLLVGHDPLIPRDSVIDACLRAARFYERQAFMQELGLAQAKAMQQASQVGDLRRMMKDPKRLRG